MRIIAGGDPWAKVRPDEGAKPDLIDPDLHEHSDGYWLTLDSNRGTVTSVPLFF
jgi:hypothetical protein